MMRLKDGFQVCQGCGGQGCYACHKQGFTVVCPGCANTETIERRENDFSCAQCGALFNKAGIVQEYEPVEESRKRRDPKTGVPIQRSRR